MKKNPRHDKDTIRHFLKAMNRPDAFNNYSYYDAIKFVGFAIKLRPTEPSLYFLMATYYSALSELDKSLFYYEEALKRGYKNWDEIRSDSSFARARQTEKFSRITSKYNKTLLD